MANTVQQKKKSTKPKVSGEFKKGEKKVKAFKKPDFVVKEPKTSKKLIPIGIGAFAAGAIAGGIASKLLAKNKAMKNDVSQKEPFYELISANVAESNARLEEAENKASNLKQQALTYLEKIKQFTDELRQKETLIQKLTSELAKEKETVFALNNQNNNLKGQLEGIRQQYPRAPF
jgi:capsule polysaccharide export protein KpsE/RkpR